MDRNKVRSPDNYPFAVFVDGRLLSQHTSFSKAYAQQVIHERNLLLYMPSQKFVLTLRTTKRGATYSEILSEREVFGEEYQHA